MNLNPKAFGLTLGIVWSVSLFAATLWIMLSGSGGATLGKLNAFYIGYSVSLPGAVIGAVYAFIDGFIGGWIIAWLYNKLLARMTAD